MPKPLVSVIVITREIDKCLKISIDSLMEQTFRNFEIFIIHSSPEFEPRITETTYQDVKMRYLRHKSDTLNSAKNEGLRCAAGKYVVFMENCDVWEPEKLEKQVKILEQNPEIGLVCCGERVKGYVFNTLVVKNFLQNPSLALFRKNCVEKTGLFDESLDVTGNWDFFLRMSLVYKFYGIEDSLLKCSLNAKKDNDRFDTFKNSGFKVLNKVFQSKNITSKELIFVNLAYSTRYMELGKKHFQNNCYEKAIGFFTEAIKRDIRICFKSDILFYYLLARYRHCVCKFYAQPQRKQ